MFLLLTRYHDWSNNIIYNYTIIYLDCTSIISHFKSMRIPEVPYVFRKICVSQFKLGFLYFSWLFSTKQTWRRFGSLTRKPSSKNWSMSRRSANHSDPWLCRVDIFFVFLPLFIIFSLVHADFMFIKEKCGIYINLLGFVFLKGISKKISIYDIYIIHIRTPIPRKIHP